MTTLAIVLACATALGTLTGPLTLFVLYRYGLVGGTPREMLQSQIALEQAKLAVEQKKLEIGDAEMKLREKQIDLQAELKRAEMSLRTNPARKQMGNPGMGLRGMPTNGV